MKKILKVVLLIAILIPLTFVATGCNNNERDETAVPSAPQDVIATPENCKVKLVWSAPENDGGSPITRYQVRFAPIYSFTSVAQPTNTLWLYEDSFACTVTTYEGRPLINGQEYFFEVFAVNSKREGSVTTVMAIPQAE
ncbi:MAG: fibronectin type III domain-containing protein [Clostridiales bacterium]|nr:fibronectin type III domain-containing protein [Clostridiales bacterium]